MLNHGLLRGSIQNALIVLLTIPLISCFCPCDDNEYPRRHGLSSIKKAYYQHYNDMTGNDDRIIFLSIVDKLVCGFNLNFNSRAIRLNLYKHMI